MNLQKVETKTLRALIYEQLREKILSGEIKPGEDLSLRILADQLCVSLMPVREAIWQLESDRILVVKNNRGIRVNSLTRDELHEALRLRILLETEALKKACTNWKSEEIVIALQKLMEKMEDIDCDPRMFLDLNKKFHMTLYSASNSQMLNDLIEKLWVRITPYVYLNITKNEDFTISPANKYHRLIFENFVNKNCKNAIEALRADIENPAIQIIEERLE